MLQKKVKPIAKNILFNYFIGAQQKVNTLDSYPYRSPFGKNINNMVNTDRSTDNVNQLLDLGNISIKQLNMHHCKGAVHSMNNSLQMMQTKNQLYICLIQEPWQVKNKILDI